MIRTSAVILLVMLSMPLSAKDKKGPSSGNGFPQSRGIDPQLAAFAEYARNKNGNAGVYRGPWIQDQGQVLNFYTQPKGAAASGGWEQLPGESTQKWERLPGGSSQQWERLPGGTYTDVCPDCGKRHGPSSAQSNDAIHRSAGPSEPSERAQSATPNQQASGIPGISFSKSAQGRIISVPDHYTTLRETLRSDPNPVVLLEFYSSGCTTCQRLERWIESDLSYANRGNISVYRILQEDSGSAISTREAYRAITQTGTPGVFLLAMDKDGDWAIVDEWSGVPKLSVEQFNSLATHFAKRFPRSQARAAKPSAKFAEPEELPPSKLRKWAQP